MELNRVYILPFQVCLRVKNAFNIHIIKAEMAACLAALAN
jgi:hypothetical protein